MQLNLFDQEPAESEFTKPKDALVVDTSHARPEPSTMRVATPDDLKYFLIRCFECDTLDEVTSEQAYDSNSYWACEDCKHALEVDADFNEEMETLRASRRPVEYKISYEHEQTRQPNGG